MRTGLLDTCTQESADPSGRALVGFAILGDNNRSQTLFLLLTHDGKPRGAADREDGKIEKKKEKRKRGARSEREGGGGADR